jgi:hypothetical protein
MHQRRLQPALSLSFVALAAVLYTAVTPASADQLLSDGTDTVSMHCFRDAAGAVMRAEVPIYTINSGDPKTVTGGCGVLRDMAGGYSFTRASSAPSELSSVVDDLRNGYVLTYELPSHAEGLHSVSILPTTNSNVHLRSRRAYYDANTGLSAQRGLQ